jgi:hypothetical protein
MRQLMFSGKGTNLKTGKEIRFEIPATLSHKGVETIMRNVRTREITVAGVSETGPEVIGQAFWVALSGTKKRDALLDEYCGMLSRRLGELLMLNGFPSNAARFEFERVAPNGKVNVRPRICVDTEIVKTPGQIGRFMEMVRTDLPQEFPEYYHPLEHGKGASA